jgi:hypothetical protein
MTAPRCHPAGGPPNAEPDRFMRPAEGPDDRLTDRAIHVPRGTFALGNGDGFKTRAQSQSVQPPDQAPTNYQEASHAPAQDQQTDDLIEKLRSSRRRRRATPDRWPEPRGNAFRHSRCAVPDLPRFRDPGQFFPGNRSRIRSSSRGDQSRVSRSLSEPGTLPARPRQVRRSIPPAHVPRGTPAPAGQTSSTPIAGTSGSIGNSGDSLHQ